MGPPSKPNASDNSDYVFTLPRAGDEAAWSVLFHECYPKVRRAVRQRIKGPLRRYVDSTDIASDVFGELAENASRFHFESMDDVRRFLCDAAYKRIIDEHRRRKTRKRDSDRERPLPEADGGADAWGISSGEPTPSQVAVAREVDEQILVEAEDEGDLGRLIVERRRDNYNNDEISRELGLPLHKIQRFLKKLRTNFLQN